LRCYIASKQPGIKTWQVPEQFFSFKNQKMPEFANDMGWIFGGTKTKRSTRLTQENRST